MTAGNDLVDLTELAGASRRLTGSPSRRSSLRSIDTSTTVGASRFGRLSTILRTTIASLRTTVLIPVSPGATFDLAALQAVGSTGAPLTPEVFRWVTTRSVRMCNRQRQMAPIYAPLSSVHAGCLGWLGELSCRMLGAPVTAFDEGGREVIDQVGELVITGPRPSMPVFFWNDSDGSHVRRIFDVFLGAWRHGVWIRITPRGSAVIYGRSDSTAQPAWGSDGHIRVLPGR
jgi:acetoacetyl-CoA synthetase